MVQELAIPSIVDADRVVMKEEMTFQGWRRKTLGLLFQGVSDCNEWQGPPTFVNNFQIVKLEHDFGRECAPIFQTIGFCNDRKVASVVHYCIEGKTCCCPLCGLGVCS